MTEPHVFVGEGVECDRCLCLRSTPIHIGESAHGPKPVSRDDAPVMSRSRLKREALSRGEPMPTFGRDEQIKKLTEEMTRKAQPVGMLGAQGISGRLMPYATSLVEKDEEIARLKEKLGIAEGALEDSFDALKRAPDLNALGYNEANAAAIKFMGTPKDVAGLDDSSYRVIAKEIHTQIMSALGKVKAALAAIREKGTE